MKESNSVVKLSLKSLAVVGCGNMGSALLQRWSDQICVDSLYIVTPRQSSVLPFLTSPTVHWLPHPNQLPEPVEVILFALKPQLLETVLPLYRRFVSQNTLFISVAAGKTKLFFQKHLGQQAILVRCMPNTPVAIGKGIVLLTANTNLSLVQKTLVNQLMTTLGHHYWFENEAAFDQTTALTGCGPAFVFQFIESLTEAAQACGLSSETSVELTQAMILGSLSYLEHTQKPPALLKQQVTSPGGMTEAGLKIMNRDHALTQLLTSVLKEAIARGIDMGQKDD